MLATTGRTQRFCDGHSRRDFLKVGALGASLGLDDLLRARDQKAATSPKAVIMICLPGGPSHLDLYDLKPDAPEDIRGEFKPIRTKVPGMDICELFPKQAKIADKFAIVRNMRFHQPDHKLHEVFTGFPTADRRPAFGSIVSRLQTDPTAVLPRYFSLSLADHPRTLAKAERPNYAGLAHQPFGPTPEFLNNLKGPPPEQLEDRRALLKTFDTIQRQIDAKGELDAMDTFSARAMALLTSPQVRDAFDLSKEKQAIRERYGPDRKSSFNYQFGHTWNGSRFLLARRLVEAGVPVVTIGEMGWDHHGDRNGVRGTIFQRTREQLPWLDQSLSALITDLHERGMAKDVAVVVWGEFGRTPRINKYGGRDHWVRAGFCYFACGGFKTGQVIGATDAQGQDAKGNPCTPQHVYATLYKHLGIDPSTTLVDFTGRPVPLLDKQEPIRELI